MSNETPDNKNELKTQPQIKAKRNKIQKHKHTDPIFVSNEKTKIKPTEVEKEN